MKQYLSVLSECEMFNGLKEQEIYSACDCLNSCVKRFKRGAVLHSEGEMIKNLSVVLVGEIALVKLDSMGNQNMVARFFAGDVALASSCFAQMPLPFDVVAASECAVLELSAANLMRSCCRACHYHGRLIENMLKIIALKNLQLSDKISILSKRSIREKVIAFKELNKDRLNQTQLADYLSVDRSALARELGKMRRGE